MRPPLRKWQQSGLRERTFQTGYLGIRCDPIIPQIIGCVPEVNSLKFAWYVDSFEEDTTKNEGLNGCLR